MLSPAGLAGRTAREHAGREHAGRGHTAPGHTARWRSAVLRAAALGVIALAAGTPVVLPAGSAPAMATAAKASRTTLASVIPSTAIPKVRVTFAVYCTSTGATSATLHGRTLGLTRHITMRPSTAAGDFTVSVILPGSIRPGTYRPSIECSDGTSTTARLLIPAFAAGGTPGGAGTWLAVGGLILIGIAAVARGIALRRRRSARPDGSDQTDETELSAHSEPSEHSDRPDYSSHSNFRF